MARAPKPRKPRAAAAPDGVAARLSSSLGRRDEGPNRALADEVARRRDAASVAQLVKLCRDSKAALRRDAAKALAALAERAPELVAPHASSFGELLDTREGVVVWSAMETLSRMAAVDSDAVFALLPQVLGAAECGSVIARDHAVRMLVRFAADPSKRARALEPLARILRTCPALQFPSYVEMTLPVVPPTRAQEFDAIVRKRARELTRPSSMRRVEKALRRFEA